MDSDRSEVHGFSSAGSQVQCGVPQELKCIEDLDDQPLSWSFSERVVCSEWEDAGMLSGEERLINSYHSG